MGWNKEWYQANKERLAAKNKAKYAANKEATYAHWKQWIANNPEKRKAQKRRYTLKHKEAELAKIIAWKRANPERHKLNNNARVRREKEQFIAAYGGACECCGEDTFEFLSLEHLLGRDATNKKQWGYMSYVRARREGYPKDKYTCLCMNCNFAKGKYGKCPHQKLLLELVAGLTH